MTVIEAAPSPSCTLGPAKARYQLRNFLNLYEPIAQNAAALQLTASASQLAITITAAGKTTATNVTRGANSTALRPPSSFSNDVMKL